MVYVLALTTRFLFMLEPIMTSERCRGEKPQLSLVGGREAVGKYSHGQSHAGCSALQLGSVLQG